MPSAHRIPLVAAAALAGALVAGAGHAQPPPYSLTLYDQPGYRGASVTLYGDNPGVGTTGFANRARSAQVRGTWRVCEGGGYRDRCEVLTANVPDLSAYGLAGRVGSAQLLAAQPAYAPDAAPAPYPAPYAEAAPQAYPPPPYAPRPQQAYPGYGPPASGAYPPGSSYQGLPSAPYAEPAYPPASFPPAPYDRSAPGAPPAPPALDTPRPRPGPATGFGRFGETRLDGWSAAFFPRPAYEGRDVSAWGPRAADGFCRGRGFSGAIYFDASTRAPQAVDPDGRPVGEGPVLRDVLCRR